jgi:hypothetical protein
MTPGRVAVTPANTPPSSGPLYELQEKAETRNLQVGPELDQQDFVIDEVIRTMKTGKTNHVYTQEPHDAGQPERHQSEGYDRSVEEISCDLDCGR